MGQSSPFRSLSSVGDSHGDFAEGRFGHLNVLLSPRLLVDVQPHQSMLLQKLEIGLHALQIPFDDLRELVDGTGTTALDGAQQRKPLPRENIADGLDAGKAHLARVVGTLGMWPFRDVNELVRGSGVLSDFKCESFAHRVPRQVVRLAATLPPFAYGVIYRR